MNFEKLLDLLADNLRERAKLTELLAWISEVQASTILTRARKSASQDHMKLKHALQYEIIDLTLRRDAEFGFA